MLTARVCDDGTQEVRFEEAARGAGFPGGSAEMVVIVRICPGHASAMVPTDIWATGALIEQKILMFGANRLEYFQSFARRE